MSTSDNLVSRKEQRRFVAEWMNAFPCIEKVSGNDKKFLCTICKQEFVVVNKKRLQDHIDSKRHQQKQNDEFKCKKKKENSHKFLRKWLEDIRFKSWLQMVTADENKFRCTLCNVDRSCTGGVANLIRHAEAPEHIKISIENGIETLKDISAEVIYESIESFENRKRAREIEFANLACSANIPYQSMPKVLKFFQDTDPKILHHMSAGATKISNIVRNVLGPAEEMRLVEILRKTKFSVYIDDTTDLNGCVKWMTFLASFLDPGTLDGTTGLRKILKLDSTNLSTEYIFHVFKEYMTDNEIPFTNILALSTDNASLMAGGLKSFKTLILKENPDLLILPSTDHKFSLERTFSMLTDISTKKRNRLSMDSINAISVIKTAIQQQEKTARAATVSDDHLSRMSSGKLYEPAAKKVIVLRLHASSNKD